MPVDFQLTRRSFQDRRDSATDACRVIIPQRAWERDFSSAEPIAPLGDFQVLRDRVQKRTRALNQHLQLNRGCWISLGLQQQKGFSSSKHLESPAESEAKTMAQSGAAIRSRGACPGYSQVWEGGWSSSESCLAWSGPAARAGACRWLENRSFKTRFRYCIGHDIKLSAMLVPEDDNPADPNAVQQDQTPTLKRGWARGHL